MIALGKYLENLRNIRGYSLRAAAERSGLSHAYIRDLELSRNRVNDRSIKPSAGTLCRLADAYNVDYRIMYRLAGYIEDIDVDTQSALYVEGKRYPITVQEADFLMKTLHSFRSATT